MRSVAARYLGDRKLTHHALRDAQDQAELFRKMLAEAAGGGSKSDREQENHVRKMS